MSRRLTRGLQDLLNKERPCWVVWGVSTHETFSKAIGKRLQGQGVSPADVLSGEDCWRVFGGLKDLVTDQVHGIDKRSFEVLPCNNHVGGVDSFIPHDAFCLCGIGPIARAVDSVMTSLLALEKLSEKARL